MGYGQLENNPFQAGNWSLVGQKSESKCPPFFTNNLTFFTNNLTFQLFSWLLAPKNIKIGGPYLI